MPKTKRILVSWIGHTDLRAMVPFLPGDRQVMIAKKLGVGPIVEGLRSPVKILVEQECFDEIHLLSNYDPMLNSDFSKWIGQTVKMHPVEVDDPTDYIRIFTVVDEKLSKIVNKQAELSIHLSSGTPTMTAIWVLLGKSKYPATFYQTYKEKSQKTEIPFDLFVDFVPELLRDPDAHLLHLASKSPQEIEGFENIIGNSQSIRLAVGLARRVAIRDVPVLLLGESGTGKELFAQAIHHVNHRGKKGKSFFAINCAALPDQLLESALFGHKKGSFTGADSDSVGLFEQADGGTLFLDEIGECNPSTQAKLLRVLQPAVGAGPCDVVFSRVGDSKSIKSDVRIIAATNRDLIMEVNDNKFREDLFYRLAVFTIKLPPLRERKGDIPEIARNLMGQIDRNLSQQPGYTHKKLSPKIFSFMKSYAWPGNVRELYNVLLRAAVTAEGDTLKLQDIRTAITEVPGKDKQNILDRSLGNGFSVDELINEIKKSYLERAMKEANNNLTRATELLGLNNYQTLKGQLEKFNVPYSRGS